MEKVKFKSLLALLLILTTATPSFAIWKVVTDPHCLKVVTTNLATQKAIEGQLTTVWIPLLPRRKNWNYIP